MSATFSVGGADREVRLLARDGTRRVLDVDGEVVVLTRGEDGETVDAAGRPVLAARDGDCCWVHVGGRTHRVAYQDPLERVRRETRARGGQDLIAPMPGVVVEVKAAVGDAVDEGDTLVVIESMKLQTHLRASAPGRVVELPLEAGASFEKGALLARIAPREGDDEEDAG